MKKGALSSFAAGFAIAFLLLCLPYGAAMFLLNRDKEPQAADNSAAVQSARGLCMLIASPYADRTADNLLLLSISPEDDAVSFSVLPGATLARTEGKAATLSEIWRGEGGRSAADALGKLLSISVDRYLNIPKAPLVEIIDRAGTLDLTLQPSGGEETSRRVLDGAAVLSLVEYTPSEMRTETLEALIGEALSQRLGLLRKSDIEKIYLTAVNAGSNDITAADFETRREALYALFSDGCTVNNVTALGEYNDGKNTFTLTKEGIDALSAAFSDDKK